MIKTLINKFKKITKERSKSGLINFLGSTAKFLFGTMDSKDRASVKNKIENFVLENEKIIKFNFDYATIVEKTVSSVNDIFGTINQNSEKLNLFEERFNELIKNSEKIGNFVEI